MSNDYAKIRSEAIYERKQEETKQDETKRDETEQKAAGLEILTPKQILRRLPIKSRQ